MNVHIILPTTGPQPMLRDMLASLAKWTPPCHLVTVLNTKEDWRRAAIRPLLECLIDNGWQSTLVDVHEQIGYVRACNQGWRNIEPEPNDTVVVCNDDLTVTGEWIPPMLGALYEGSLLVGPSMKTVGGDGLWGGEDDPPYIEGWLFGIRAATIRAASRDEDWLFDPIFMPQLCEDMDLSLRIGLLDRKQIPWLTVPTVMPDVPYLRSVSIPIQHERSATIGKDREPYWTENRRKLVDKWNLGSGGRIVVADREAQWDIENAPLTKKDALSCGWIHIP